MAIVRERPSQTYPENHFQLKTFALGLAGVAFIAAGLKLPLPQTVGELLIHLLPLYVGLGLFARAVWKFITTPDRFPS